MKEKRIHKISGAAQDADRLREKLLRFNDYMDFFERDGNFSASQDPYRHQVTPFYKQFFNEQGYLTEDAKEFLREFVKWPGIKPMCDAVKMLVADEFACNTKGNYSTIYLWR